MLITLYIGPIEVDLVVEANSITGTITCHDNASAIDSLSCEVRRMSGKVDKPMIPCMSIAWCLTC